MATSTFSSLQWGKVDLENCPQILVPPPGPRSGDYHRRCARYFKGLSTQVKLFPVAFESGAGCVLVDVDGNRYIDFSSGIYVTTLGHCHPKVSEAVARYAGQLMNAHDFTTPIKTLLVEKLPQVLPGDFSGFQFYDAGTAAVEAGMRVLRAATGRNEMISCFNDFHGKTYGAVSLAQIRSAGLWPRANARRPHGPPSRPLPAPVDEARRHDRHRSAISPSTTSTSRRPPSATWPASCWNRSRAGQAPSCRRTISSPSCGNTATASGCCIMADEVLTSWGRTGKWLCMEHWNVLADIVAIGKGFGNGFPVTAVAVREPYKESFEKISASSSYGGNPMACAAALASTEVIEEENLLEHALHLGQIAQRRMERMKAEHPIVGDVRAQGLPHGDRAGQGPQQQGAFRPGRHAGLPEGLPQGAGLDPGRTHPPHEPADRDG